MLSTVYVSHIHISGWSEGWPHPSISVTFGPKITIFAVKASSSSYCAINSSVLPLGLCMFVDRPIVCLRIIAHHYVQSSNSTKQPATIDNCLYVNCSWTLSLVIKVIYKGWRPRVIQYGQCMALLQTLHHNIHTKVWTIHVMSVAILYFLCE